MKEKIMFFIMMYCCYGIFLQSIKKDLMLKDPTVRWLIETLLEEKNLFSLLMVYEQVVFLRVLAHRKYRRPRSRPHLIDHIFGARITLILLFASLFY